MTASPDPQRADRNLLLAVIALQMDFVTREQLVATTTEWVRDKSRSLGELFLHSGVLDKGVHDLLVALVEKHLENHGDDPELSLESLSSIGSVREELNSIGDPELQASLTRVSALNDRSDPVETQPLSSATNAGQTGRFRVLRPHARGGLGEVYVARDEELNREVALKQIKQRHADDETSRVRFTLEAEVTGGLEHPGIVPVYGLGHYADGRPFYAMRFIRGDSLKSAVEQFYTETGHQATAPFRETTSRNDPPKAADETLQVGMESQSRGSLSEGTERRAGAVRTIAFRKLLGRLIDVCNAIEYAHSRGVLHRDLKPGNIMLGKYGETLVVDWGLAKTVGASDREAASKSDEPHLIPRSTDSGSAETVTGQALGTPAFMSPEQAAGRLDMLGPRSDIYSLGATLYVILTGKPPFADTGEEPIVARVQTGRFPSSRTVNPAVPPALDAVCLKAMSLNPDDRYASAGDFAADLEAWLADEPTSAWTEPVTVRCRRWLARHQTLATTTVAVLLVSAIGLASFAVVLGGKNQDLSTANQELERQKNELAEINQQMEVANTRIREAQAEAENKAAIATAINDFLRQDLLAQASPDQEPDREIKLIAVLNRAAERIEDRFADKPLVEAAIRYTIGDAYLELGDYRSAGPHVERYRDLTVAHLGARHQDTLVAMNQLGHMYSSLGRFKDAEDVYREAWELGKASLGEHAVTLTSVNGLALSIAEQNRHDEAEVLFKEVLGIRQRLLGDDHPDTLTSMHNLATFYSSLARFDEAEELLIRTLDGRRRVLGEGHPRTLITQSQLGLHYKSQGEFEKALPLYQAALEGSRRRLTNDHPDTLTAINNLGSMYQEMQRLDESAKLLTEALEIATRIHGPNDARMLLAMNNLARTYASLGRLDEAEPLYTEALELARRLHGVDNLVTMACMNNLAALYNTQGRPNEAEPLHKEVLAHIRRVMGNKHPNTLACANGLATCYEAQNRYAEAEPLYRETLESLLDVLGEEHPNSLKCMGNLARVCMVQAKYEEARPHLERAYKIYRRKLGEGHELTLSTATTLAAAVQKMGQHERVEELLTPVVTHQRQNAAGSLALATHLHMIAGSQIALERFEEAEAAARECLEIHQQHLPGEDWQEFSSKSLLGEILTKQKEYSEAEPLLIEAYEGIQKHSDSISERLRRTLPLAALKRLVDLYESWGRTDDAVKWNELLESKRAATLETDDA